MFEIWQGINPMGLSSSFSDYKKNFTDTKMPPTNLRRNTQKIQGVYPVGLCAPWSESFIHN